MFGIESKNPDMQSQLDYIILHHNMILQNQDLNADNGLTNSDGIYSGVTSIIEQFAYPITQGAILGAEADIPTAEFVSTESSNLNGLALQFIHLVNDYAASTDNKLIAGSNNGDLELIEAKPDDNLISIDEAYETLMNSDNGKKLKDQFLSTYSNNTEIKTENQLKAFQHQLDLQLKSAFSSRLLLEQNLNLLSQISDPNSPVHDENSPERKALVYGLACTVDDCGDFVGSQNHGLVLCDRSITAGFSHPCKESVAKELRLQKRKSSIEVGKAMAGSYIDGDEFNRGVLTSPRSMESIDKTASRGIEYLKNKPYFDHTQPLYMNLSKEDRIQIDKNCELRFQKRIEFDNQWEKKIKIIIDKERDFDEKIKFNKSANFIQRLFSKNGVVFNSESKLNAEKTKLMEQHQHLMMEKAKFCDNLQIVAGDIKTGNIVGIDQNNKPMGYTAIWGEKHFIKMGDGFVSNNDFFKKSPLYNLVQEPVKPVVATKNDPIQILSNEDIKTTGDLSLDSLQSLFYKPKLADQIERDSKFALSQFEQIPQNSSNEEKQFAENITKKILSITSNVDTSNDVLCSDIKTNASYLEKLNVYCELRSGSDDFCNQKKYDEFMKNIDKLTEEESKKSINLTEEEIMLNVKKEMLKQDIEEKVAALPPITEPKIPAPLSTMTSVEYRQSLADNLAKLEPKNEVIKPIIKPINTLDDEIPPIIKSSNNPLFDDSISISKSKQVQDIGQSNN